MPPVDDAGNWDDIRDYLGEVQEEQRQHIEAELRLEGVVVENEVVENKAEVGAGREEDSDNTAWYTSWLYSGAFCCSSVAHAAWRRGPTIALLVTAAVVLIARGC
jgi:hypothetical protein